MKNYLSLLLSLSLAFTLLLCGCANAETDGNVTTAVSELSGEDDPEDLKAGAAVTAPHIYEDETAAEPVSEEESTALPAETTASFSEATVAVSAAAPDPVITTVALTTEKPQPTETKAQTEKAETSQAQTTAAQTEKEEPTEITSGGMYTLSGIKKDVCITVDAGDEDVFITLDGVTLNCESGPAIYVRSAGNVELILAEGCENTIWDGQSYSLTDGDSILDGAIFSRADLTVSGEGTLNVYGCFKHGIVSKDDLIINSGTLNITSSNVGLSGKDCVTVNGGTVTVDSGTDGIRSKNLEDAAKGAVTVNGGALFITSGNDGIQASSALTVNGGTINIRAGKDTTADGSYKGLKANGDVNLNGGECTVFAKDDAVHSDTKVTVTGTNLLGSGISGAKQGVSAEGQGVLLIKTDDRTADTALTVKNANGETVASFAPPFDYSVVFITNSAIVSGEEYTVTVDTSEGVFVAK